MSQTVKRVGNYKGSKQGKCAGHVLRLCAFQDKDGNIVYCAKCTRCGAIVPISGHKYFDVIWDGAGHKTLELATQPTSTLPDLD